VVHDIAHLSVHTVYLINNPGPVQCGIYTPAFPFDLSGTYAHLKALAGHLESLADIKQFDQTF